MKKIIISAILIITNLIMVSCFDVDEVVYDQFDAEQFYASPAGANVALANVYSHLAGNWGGVGYAGADNGWYDINSMSTDEQVIPHRTTGDWELSFAQMHKREWLPTHSQINNTWNWLYRSVFSANLAVDLLTNANAEPSKIAEARVLRAFFYYLLLDGFGSVPFFTENTVTVDQMPQKSRQEIFDFVVSELTQSVDKLSPVRGGEYYGRFNKWAGYTLLAKLYLNAEVYTGVPMWEECLEACRRVSEGGFTLHSGAESDTHPLGSSYFELFGDVLPESETILALYTEEGVVGRNIFTVRSFGGTDGLNILGYSAWNGTIVPENFVAKFPENDIRRRQFRYGPNPHGPQPAGFIVYSTLVDNIDNPGAPPNAGIRNQKFWPAPPASSAGASNDFPIFRYADVMLMMAECLIRTDNAADAKVLIDQVRIRAGLDPLPANPTLEDVYIERAKELSWEGHRRQDMIRFGTFTNAHGLIPAVPDHFKIFPIPTSALDANPNLRQNPGF